VWRGHGGEAAGVDRVAEGVDEGGPALGCRGVALEELVERRKNKRLRKREKNQSSSSSSPSIDRFDEPILLFLTCGNSFRQYSDWFEPSRPENQSRRASMAECDAGKRERERREWGRERVIFFFLFAPLERETVRHLFSFFEQCCIVFFPLSFVLLDLFD
jgi:hypothetical protein